MFDFLYDYKPVNPQICAAGRRDRVSSRVHEPLHVFWEMMEYFANTMIFIFTGLKVAITIYEKDEILPRDWGWAIVLYLALNVRSPIQKNLS